MRKMDERIGVISRVKHAYSRLKITSSTKLIAERKVDGHSVFDAFVEPVDTVGHGRS